MSLEERLARIEKALFGFSADEEPERAFLFEFEQAIRELAKGNKTPLDELMKKHKNLASKIKTQRRYNHE